MPQTEDRSSIIWKTMMGAERLLLTTHIRPDGDGIASELALSMILRSLGREVLIVNQDSTPEMYRWLPGAAEIMVYNHKLERKIGTFDLAVLLDCSSRSRIGDTYLLVQKSERIVCIDHHEHTECLGDPSYVDPRASSISEILYSMVPNIDHHLSPEVATCLYTSILTDTGSFSQANTTAEVFRIAAHLVERGACPDEVYRKVYRNKRMAHFRLLSKALEGLCTAESGKVAYAMLPLPVFREAEAFEEDTEGILDVMKGLQGVELIALLRQLDEGSLKVSLRSTNHISCSHLARLFGGGGHSKASGFTYQGRVEKVGEEIMQRIIEEVKVLAWI